jgi:pimeloyl-ACP methyl ester carboxylesterase
MSSATPLVVLPGLDGTDVFLRPFAAALPDSITPRIVSYPTHGPQDYQTLLSIVDEATRRLPSFHVLGWSFGGPLALMLAARHAERIRGVVLVSSFVRAPHPLLAPLGPAIRGPVMWTYRFARRAPLWLRPRSDPWRAAKAETWNRIPAAVIAARLRAVAALDARSTLSACRAPLLCLVSEADRVVSARHARELRELYPETQLETLPGRHFTLYTHPDVAARAVARFVEAGANQSALERRRASGSSWIAV